MFRTMASCLFVAILVCVLPRDQGFVIPQDDSELDLEPTSRKEPLADDVSQSIMASLSAQQLAEDDALLKTIVHDATSDGDSDLATEMEAMFLSTVLHLLGQGEMYRDARMDAITAALQSAFLATTGRVDHDYIEKVLRAIREKDEQNRRLDDEHQTNVLRFVHSDDQELLDRGISLPTTLSGVADDEKQ